MKKTIILTGASSGIGKATAILLAQKGHTVYALARTAQSTQELRQPGIHPFNLDVTKDEDCKSCIDTILSQTKVDVLINNAGFGLYGALEDLTMDQVRYELEVNVLGYAKMMKLLFPHFRNQNGGRIINVASIAGKMYAPVGAWYHTTKHAVEGLSDCLRVDIKQYGIDVVIIEPGLINTPFYDRAGTIMDESSGQGAYANLVHGVDITFHKIRSGSGNFGGSPPELVAQAMCKAVEAQKPKLRYRIGNKSRISVWGRNLLPDRLYDILITKSMAPKS